MADTSKTSASMKLVFSLRAFYNRKRMNEVRRKPAFARRAAIIAMIALGAPAFSAKYRTTLYNVRVKLESNRTATIDETIDLALEQGSTGGIRGLVVGEAATGAKKISFLVAKAILQAGAQVLPLDVAASGNTLVANIPADALQNQTKVELHLNYSVLGSFVDRTGGKLGKRSTFTWNAIPTRWPNPVLAGSIEVQSPESAAPVYTGGTIGPQHINVNVDKTLDAAFAGDTSALKVSSQDSTTVFQPVQTVPAGEGFRLMVALPVTNLQPAPDKLAPPPAPIVSSAPTTAVHHGVSNGGAALPAKTPLPPNPWAALAPLAVPVLFLLFQYRRFTFTHGHGFPTSTVPANLGPAEIGILLDEHIRMRHVMGTMSDLADRGVIKLSPVEGGQTVQIAAANPEELTSLERRLLQLLSQKAPPLTSKDLNSLFDGARLDLEGRARERLVETHLLFPSTKWGRGLPGLLALIALGLTGLVAIRAGLPYFIASMAISVVALGLLVKTLSRLTLKGISALDKSLGLRKYIAAEIQAGAADTLRSLRPYAIAMGLLAPEG